MLDNLTKTRYVDFHLIPRLICGYINFVHDHGALTHTATADLAPYLHGVRAYAAIFQCYTVSLWDFIGNEQYKVITTCELYPECDYNLVRVLNCFRGYFFSTLIESNKIFELKEMIILIFPDFEEHAIFRWYWDIRPTVRRTCSRQTTRTVHKPHRRQF